MKENTGGIDNMKWFTVRMALCAAGFMVMTGCGSSEKSESPNFEDLKSPEATEATSDAPLQEWKEIWSVEVRGKDVNAKKVGYLVKSFTPDDPQGRYFVRDLVWDTRGFLLPEGKAFAYEPRGSVAAAPRDLGNTGFENGVKKILKVTGEVQIRPVVRPAAAPTQG